MNISRKPAMGILILALFLSQSFSRGSGRGKKTGSEKVLEQLKLSKNQILKIRSIKKEIKSSRIKIYLKIRAAKKELRRALISD